ncbi:UNVERIFIED_ORG: hypothetical protein JN05_00239 [Zoogloea ramigera]|jgi:hypothetical protein|uniref:Uncharacterized protein n=1 Tax=Duganella zoogloeoides TaxID=75659 RepID=A0ABZ0XRS4_9BURK|nr:hypothetical protein [Duganella zoogloeoides]WQH02442.1 hypothetical protein SR858_15300 [Duganella zoogloeoides]
MTKSISTTPFINVLVRVKKHQDADTYDVTCEPSIPKVVQKDTVINFQIVDTFGQDIVFSGLTVTPKESNQISAPAISTSGKLLTVSDSCSHNCWLNLNLEFTNKTAGHRFMHDPQVENDSEG